jgi:hypothetical protein
MVGFDAGLIKELEPARRAGGENQFGDYSHAPIRDAAAASARDPVYLNR